MRAAVLFYLWLFRGTPVLLQLVFAFNVLPSFGILLPGFACGVLALGLNEAAYMAEIMRSGIRAVGPGQRLAARRWAFRIARSCAGSCCRRRCASLSRRSATSSSAC